MDVQMRLRKKYENGTRELPEEWKFLEGNIEYHSLITTTKKTRVLLSDKIMKKIITDINSLKEKNKRYKKQCNERDLEVKNLTAEIAELKRYNERLDSENAAYKYKYIAFDKLNKHIKKCISEKAELNIPDLLHIFDYKPEYLHKLSGSAYSGKS